MRSGLSRSRWSDTTGSPRRAYTMATLFPDRVTAVAALALAYRLAISPAATSGRSCPPWASFRIGKRQSGWLQPSWPTCKHPVSLRDGNACCSRLYAEQHPLRLGELVVGECALVMQRGEPPYLVQHAPLRRVRRHLGL